MRTPSGRQVLKSSSKINSRNSSKVVVYTIFQTSLFTLSRIPHASVSLTLHAFGDMPQGPAHMLQEQRL